MTKPISQRMRNDAFLNCIMVQFGAPLLCAICSKPIVPGQRIQFDHRIADGIGGAHEYQNIKPVHAELKGEFDCHQRKTSHPRGPHTSIDSDTHAAAKLKRLRGETGTGPKRKIAPRPFQKAPEGHSSWPKKAVRG